MLEAATRRQLPARTRSERPPGATHEPFTTLAILCVDDHVQLLDCLKRVFMRRGWQVQTATDAETALVVIRREAVDAVVTDLRLPGISGLMLIRTMLSEGIELPTVIYTAYPEPETANEASALGIAYVSKLDVPGPQALAHIVLGVIDRHRAHRESMADELAWFLMTTGARLAVESPSSAWQARVTRSVARYVANATLTFPMFLTSVEVLRVLLDPRTTPPVASAFMRLQADRCRRRSEIAHAARLDQVIAALSRDSQSWKSIRSLEGIPARFATVDVGKSLRAMGWSFEDVIRAVTLRRAVALVALTHDQIAQIAYQLGFEHAASFNRFFKHLLGLAPREFRDLILDI